MATRNNLLRKHRLGNSLLNTMIDKNYPIDEIIEKVRPYNLSEGYIRNIHIKRKRESL